MARCERDQKANASAEAFSDFTRQVPGRPDLSDEDIQSLVNRIGLFCRAACWPRWDIAGSLGDS